MDSSIYTSKDLNLDKQTRTVNNNREYDRKKMKTFKKKYE